MHVSDHFRQISDSGSNIHNMHAAILHVVYSSLTACMNIIDLQNWIVLKICKYQKRTGTNSIATEIKKVYMYMETSCLRVIRE